MIRAVIFAALVWGAVAASDAWDRWANRNNERKQP